MQLLFSVCLLGILSVSLCQFKYYVDAVNGTDLMGFGSKEHPVKTLTYVLDHMEGNTSIIYLRKVQNFSDLTSTMKIISDLTIKCWMDEEITPSPESYPTIFLNSSEISFIVAGSLTFDGIRFQKPDNISLKTLINITSSAKLSLQNFEISNYSSDGLEPLISSESNSSIYFENVTFSRLNPMPASLVEFNGNKFQMNGVNVIGCKFTDSPAFNLNGSFSFNLRNSRFESNTLHSNPIFLLTTETEEQLVIDTVNVKSNLGSPLQKCQSMALFLLLDSKSSKMSLSNSSFDRNSLFDCNGTTGMNVTGGQFNATNCNFSNNQALAMNKGYGGTGVLTIYSSKVSLQNLSCKSNYHQSGGAIYLGGTSSLSISGSNFTANKAGDGGAIYLMSIREGWLRDNIFDGNEADFGGALFFGNTIVFSEKNTFSNGEASWGGAVAIRGFSRYIDEDSNYINNYATYGGALHCEQGYFEIFNTFLSKNHAHSGGCLYVKNASPFIVNSKFFNCTADKGDGGAIFMSIGAITIFSVVFESNVANYGRGGALFIEDGDWSNLTVVTLLKNKALQGGGLFAINKQLKSYLRLYYSRLEQNVAYLTGGGVHLEGIINSFLINSTFFNNSGYDPKRGDSLSKGNLKGGAIFYSCQPLIFPCLPFFRILDVRSNSAEIGGAIYFNNLIFSPILGSNFANNSATRYGPTFASYPYQLWIAQELCNGTNPRIRFSFENGTDFTYDNFIQNFFIYNWTDERHWDRVLNPTQNLPYPNMSMEINYSDQVAGTLLSPSLSFYALDVFGQQITEDNYTNSLKLIPLKDTPRANTISTGSTNGSFSFNRFYSSRNTNITLGIQSKVECKVFSSNGITINIQYRECRIGEILPYKSDICTACPPNTYSLIFPENSSVLCQTCDKITGLMCKEGGSHLAVGLGYWRFNTSSLNVIPCLNPDSCIPTVPNTNNCSDPLKPANLEKSCASISNLDDMKARNLSCSTQQQLDDILKYCDLVKNGTELGFCNEQKGYKAGGILCTECAEGWGKSKNYECVQCKPNFSFFSSLILIVVIKIGIITYTVNLARKDKKDRSHSTMLRIFITFFQIESLLLSVPMYWPPFIDEIRKFLISFFSRDVNPGGYSFDCILYWAGMKSPGLLSYFASNALYSFFAPVLWTIFLSIILSIRRFVFKSQISWQQAKDILKITFLVTYFYFWPEMITHAFGTLNPLDIGPEGAGQWRLLSDPIIVWDSGKHRVLMCFGITALIVSGLCLPFLFFLKMWKHKNLLDDEKFIQTYGFIYQGYREEYYLWEFLILIRKMALVATSVFFVQQLTFMCITLSIIIVISFGLQRQFSPFKNNSLNRLELTAQICLAAINYGSLYHLNLVSTTSTIFFVSLTTVATVLFLIPWIRAYKEVIKEKVEPVYQSLKTRLKGRSSLPKQVRESQTKEPSSTVALNQESDVV